MPRLILWAIWMVVLVCCGTVLRLTGWGNPSWVLVFAPIWLPATMFAAAAACYGIVLLGCKLLPEEE